MNKEAKQRVLDFQETFGTKAGERVLEHLIVWSTMRISSVESTGKVDTNRLLFNEGKRVVILWIMELLNKDPYEQRQTIAKE